MNKKYIMALDQGTTSSRCIVFDKKGNIILKSQREFPQIYPKSGWVEHNPADILDSVFAVMGEVLSQLPNGAASIDSVGITNQRESVIIWDKETGVPIYNAIVWQCRRTATHCQTLTQEGYDKVIYEKTGLKLDAYFSATKIAWVLDNVKGAREKAQNGQLAFGTIDTFLLWNLTKGRVYATDYSNACRTMLFNIHSLQWDDELLNKFKIPNSMLPNVYPSSYEYGIIGQEILGEGIRINALCGDQQAALFGQFCDQSGAVKNTYGTGCFMLMNTGEKCVTSNNGLITTLTASVDNKPHYALEGSVFMGGAVIQWLRDELSMINTAAESESYALKVADTSGVYIVPAFVGLGAPYWDSSVRGILCGLTRGSRKEHIIRACLEAIAYQSYDVFKAMEEDAGFKIKDIDADGGASDNGFLMQFQADILDANVRVSAVSETTALGVCVLSGLKSGYFKSITEAAKSFNKCARFYKPKMNKETRDRLVSGWHEAIKCVIRR